MTKPAANSVSMEAMSRMNLRDMLVMPDASPQIMLNLTRFYATDSSAEGENLEVASRESLEAAYGFDRPDVEDRKPFVYQDGVAVIPIHGTLLNRCNWSWGFVTGFQYIRRMMNAALEDDDVETIVFDVDSPGGEAAGCFELAREIIMSRRVKPSLAMVDSVAASGGMALAGAATKMYAIPSARVGSIGVYKMHISYEDNLKQSGIKVTFASAGDHKVDGNMYQDLPKAVLDEWRESAGKTWDDFITLVADSRGMSEDDVRATQARVYRADEALAKGLIDAVKTPTEAVAAFLAELADDPSFNDDDEELNMADKPNAAPKQEVTSGLTDADLTKIATIAAEAGAKAAQAIAAGVERKQAIRDHASSKGKGFAALAKTLCDNEALSADDAIVIIDAAAGTSVAKPAKPGKGNKARVQAAEGDEDEGDEEGDEGDDGDEDEGDEDGDEGEQSRDTTDHFAATMGRTKQPNAGGGRAKGGQPGQRADGVNPLLRDHAQVTGADWSAKAQAKH